MPTGSLETIEFAAARRITGAQVFYSSEFFINGSVGQVVEIPLAFSETVHHR